MESICTEDIISSLIVIGFESVDSLLFTYTLGDLSINPDARGKFKYVDAELSKEFSKYICYDGLKFQLKDGLQLDTKVPVKGLNVSIPIIRKLQANKKLVEYLNDLDFSEIVSKKIGNIENDDLRRILVCPYEERIISGTEAKIKEKKRIEGFYEG